MQLFRNSFLFVLLVVAITLAAGCSDIAGNNSEKDMEGMVRQYVSNIDNGDYEAAIRMLYVAAYPKDPSKDTFLPTYRSIGGPQGENIEIKDINVVATADEGTASAEGVSFEYFSGEATLTCKVFINGKQVTRPLQKLGEDSTYEFTFDKTEGTLHMHSAERVAADPIFDLLIKESVPFLKS